MTKKKSDEIEYKVKVHQTYRVMSNEPLTPSEVNDRIADMFASGNILVENEFWENTSVICRECGITIGYLDRDPDDKIPYAYCPQCQVEKDKKDKDVKIV